MDCGGLLKDLTPEQYAAMEPSYDPGDLYDGLGKAEVREKLNVPAAAKILEKLRARLPPGAGPMQLLDIGCGAGRYLLAGRDLGFAVRGVEPSAAHSRVGRELFGLEIHTGYFDETIFQPPGFDLVILSHVIEHIYEPGSFLAAVARVVKPGGVIAIWTPNANYLPARPSGLHWTMLVPVDHVTMMTRRSLELVAPRGFNVEISTGEAPGEPAITLALGIRNALRASLSRNGRSATSGTQARCARYGVSSDVVVQRSWSRLVPILGALSWPLAALGRWTDNRGCLNATLQAPPAEQDSPAGKS